MSEEQPEQSKAAPDGMTYEAPLVEDLESEDGPAVTAAGGSGPK